MHAKFIRSEAGMEMNEYLTNVNIMHIYLLVFNAIKITSADM